MSTFIELGVGFNPDLAARDNVALNGIMLGLSPREARARFDARDRVRRARGVRQDLKLKNYSSGMHVRLAFSVMIQVDADVLLIDEVLAVGDAAFQQKCFDVFNRMRDEGKTILFVTHDMGAVTRFCHRAMLLERGEMVDASATRATSPTATSRSTSGAPSATRRRTSAAPGWATARPASATCGLASDRDERRAVAPQSRAADAEDARDVQRRGDGPGRQPDAAQRAPSAGRGRDHDRRTTSRRAASRRVSRRCSPSPSTTCWRPGGTTRSLTITHRGDGLDVIDRFAGGLSFVVTGMSNSGGMVEIPVQTDVTRWGAAPASQAATSGTQGERAHAARAARRSGARRGDGRADARAARAGRQLATLLAPRLQHRAQRIQAEVLRLGARLRVAGDAPAAAVRRAVRLLHEGLQPERGQKGDKFYGAQLLGSVVLFTFFAEATGGAVRSVVERENLVRKIQFPRLVIPMSVVLLALFNLGLNLIVVLVFALASGVHPMLSWLELPLIVAMLCALSLGVAMLLSALFVRFRDIQPIWDVVSQILFYAAPVIISIETVREKLLHHEFLMHLYTLNPLVADLPAVPARDDLPRHAQRRPGDGRVDLPARATGCWCSRSSWVGSGCSTAKRRTSPRTCSCRGYSRGASPVR